MKKKYVRIGGGIYSIFSDDDYLDAIGDDFEPHMVQLFRALVGPNDVVADIGANIGLTAILFSSLAKRTYAFEPSPSTYRILSQNLAQNGLCNVELVNRGLGEKEEALTITFARNNRSGGYVSDKIRPETGHVTEEICIDTLDHFFADKAPVPTFLKIDVEGFEQSVIRGGQRFLETARPIVVMEMNHFCLDVLQRITIPDFLDFMGSVFPFLYAVDTDNVAIVDLHWRDQAYMVMHEHVVRHRFPNLVGGWCPTIKPKLDELSDGVRAQSLKRHITPALSKPEGKIVALTSLETIRVGEAIEIPVSVSNESDEVWHGCGDHPVFLSYHWQNKDGISIIFDGVRTELQRPYLAPGDTLEQKVRVFAPGEKGKYRLVLTLVQEGVCWFEGRGFEEAAWSVLVV